MRSLSSKAQFFILTSVIIVGVFFTLSKYVNQYSFIDTSKAAEGSEVFMFENIKEKAIKTVGVSNITNVNSRLSDYESFVEDMVADRGYTLIFDYNIVVRNITFDMTLMSGKYILESNFWQPVSSGVDYSCDDYCRDWGYSSGVCEQNPFGQCENRGGDYKEVGDVYCTAGPQADTCCCFP